VTFEDKLRTTITQHLSALETVLYAAVAVLLVVAASVGVVRGGIALWGGLSLDSTTTAGLLALDHLLLVLMLIEILHIVRISIRTRHLTMVPFLIVGLNCVHSARVGHHDARSHNGRARLQAAPEQAMAFRYSKIELGLASILFLVLVFSIVRLRAMSRQIVGRCPRSGRAPFASRRGSCGSHGPACQCPVVCISSP
jgi:Phosphate-starvation-inducible E family